MGLLLQIVLASMNMVAGLLAVTYYTLYVARTGVVTSPVMLLQISVFTFIFGILSFTIACLAAMPLLNGRSAPMENTRFVDYTPQITTKEYVTQRRQTVVEQALVGLACPDCGRMVSLDDNFCDICGAQFKEIPQPSAAMQVEGTEKA
jgi:hypothetical protein